ncbi:hypothetical protein EVAR_71202_1 [Eumeta japonica]|uniref:Fibronectin type-III domain-containing protein n=1 Tax=Eumeta variegata TaxID=151549 RepID=A0A4C2A9R4_EUMVA|nr:hypothetical protein EVAR_71202_1 [Eumeta japonica]
MIYRGSETKFTIENLEPGGLYQFRVCPIRITSTGEDLQGAYTSPFRHQVPLIPSLDDIVVIFWAMLQLKCLPALMLPPATTAIQRAPVMGILIIMPTILIWGHSHHHNPYIPITTADTVAIIITEVEVTIQIQTQTYIIVLYLLQLAAQAAVRTQ